MNRIASCSCDELQITVSGDPVITVACNCTNCQKRTGSAFGISAYFKNAQIVEIKGSGKVFRHFSDAGKEIKRTFCTNCGSTVYWEAAFQPGYTGVAVGCFTDPAFPEPRFSCWNVSKLNWVNFPEHWHALPKQELPQKT